MTGDVGSRLLGIIIRIGWHYVDEFRHTGFLERHGCNMAKSVRALPSETVEVRHGIDHFCGSAMPEHSSTITVDS